MDDLAPHIYRQRLLIEGWRYGHITADECVDYIVGLADVLDMDMIGHPYTTYAPGKGMAAWGHWTTSGVQVMAFDEAENQCFVTIIIDTCRAFWPLDAVAFTQRFWQMWKLAYDSMWPPYWRDLYAERLAEQPRERRPLVQNGKVTQPWPGMLRGSWDA